MRLIDADKLKVYLQEYLHYEHAISWVDAQPTAFDLDKVVQELEEHPNLFRPFGGDGYDIPLHNAIEVVKAGGIDERD